MQGGGGGGDGGYGNMAQVKCLSFLTRSNSEFSLPSILMLFIFLFRPEVTAWAWVATATGKT